MNTNKYYYYNYIMKPYSLSNLFCTTDTLIVAMYGIFLCVHIDPRPLQILWCVLLPVFPSLSVRHFVRIFYPHTENVTIFWQPLLNTVQISKKIWKCSLIGPYYLQIYVLLNPLLVHSLTFMIQMVDNGNCY